MASINEIISTKATEGIVTTDKAITALDIHTLTFIQTVEALSSALKKGNVSLKEVNAATNKSKKTTQELTQLEKDLKTANQALETQRKSGIRIMAKYDASVKKEKKSEQDLMNITNELVRNTTR